MSKYYKKALEPLGDNFMQYCDSCNESFEEDYKMYNCLMCGVKYCSECNFVKMRECNSCIDLFCEICAEKELGNSNICHICQYSD